MAHVTCVYYPPEIVPYVDMDEEIYFTGTFEEVKQNVLERLEFDREKIAQLTYKEWKKHAPLPG